MNKYKLTNDELFNQLKFSIGLVAKGLKNCIIVSGNPGVGKSSTVRQTLKDNKADYVWATTYIKKVNDLYKVLYKNNKVIVFDDTENILHKRKGASFKDLLMSATDLKKSRQLQLNDLSDRDITSGKYPQTFEFTGALIFITNLDRKYIEPSLLSRSLFLSLRFSKEDILYQIEKNIDRYYPEVQHDAKVRVLNFMKEIKRDVTGFDFRQYHDILLLHVSGESRWREWSYSLYCS